MFEAYKVAVKVALEDKVTKGILGMSVVFKQLGAQADEFKKKLKDIKNLAIVGAGLAGGGFLGLHLIKGALKPAEDYAHQLNIMNMAGLKHVEIAQAVNAAWKNTSNVLTSTATGNLRTILDLRNVFGHTGEAIQYMPELSMIQAVLKASSEGSVSQNSDTLVYSLAKALDIRGAVNSPAQFNEQAELMAKVITATQGRVLPQDYQMLFKYGRQAIPGLSNQFLYEELPTLMMEMKSAGGGGSHGGFGTSLAAFYRFFVQGIMTKSALQGMKSLGLISANAGLRTTTVGTQLMQGEHISNVALAQSDPFLWTQNVLLPALRKKFGDNLTKNQLSLAIGDVMRGASQTAIFGVLQFALKAQQIYRDEKLIKQAKDPRQAFAMALANDPDTANAALSAQWTNLKTSFTMGVIPVLVPVLAGLAKGFNILGKVLREYPNLTKTLVLGFIGLSVAMSGVGMVLLATAGGKGLIWAFRTLRIGMIVAMVPFSEFIMIIGSLAVAIYGAYKAFKTLYDLYESRGHDIHNNLGSSIFISPQQSHSPIHTHLFLDGKEVANVVTKHQASASNRQPAHGSTYNGNMNLSPGMINYAGI